MIIAYVQTLCCIVNALYGKLYERKDTATLIKGLKTEGKNDDIKIIYEAFLIFAFMWSFGVAVDEGMISFSSMLKSRANINVPE